MNTHMHMHMHTHTHTHHHHSATLPGPWHMKLTWLWSRNTEKQYAGTVQLIPQIVNINNLG